MKPTKIITFVLVLVMFTSVAWAASVNGEYKGFPIVNVTLNGQPVTSSVPATNFYGSTVLPVRAVAESLGTVVNWDAKTSTANLIKINVEMIICEDITLTNDEFTIKNVYTPMHTAGYYYDFLVFYDSDVIPEGLLKGTYSIRTVICDSNKDILYTSLENTYNADEDGPGFWGASEYTNVCFMKPGDYTLEFQMKADGGTYQTMDKRILRAEAE